MCIIIANEVTNLHEITPYEITSQNIAGILLILSIDRYIDRMRITYIDSYIVIQIPDVCILLNF